jgi:uncharacterized protein involved in exopolysaccharide biosynthesis
LTDDDRHTLRDALYVVFKRRLRIGVVTLGAMAAGVGYNALAGASYTASARIVATAAPGGAEPGAPTALVFQDRGQLARSQAALFGDPGLLRPLLPALKARLQTTDRRPVAVFLAQVAGWFAGRADPDEALYASLTHALSAAAIGDTDVVALRFTWPDPRFAADALNLILSGDETAVSRAAGARLDIKLADQALHDADAQVQALDAQLAAVPVGQDEAEMERQRDRIASRLAASHGTGDALRVERELAQRKLDTVEQAFRNGGWVDSPDAQDTPSGAPALQQTFVTLLDKHQTMLTHLPPDSASVRAVDAQIGQVREQNFLAVKQLLTSKIASLDARLSRLDADIAADESGARNTDDSLVKLDALAQTRAAAAARAAAAQRRYDDAKLEVDALGREVSGIHVVSAAAAPGRPDAPAPAVLVVMTGFLGLALGVLSAFLAELTRRTMDRPRDIARLLDIEVLARVPDFRA